MADLKISQLGSIVTVVPATDVLPVVQGATTYKMTPNQILGSGGVATLASASITGAATVGTTLGVTGVSTFAAGTALLPALTTTGDTNTGIYYPAADTFAVTTAGVERYRVNSSGNLGIGVTPSAWESTFKAIQINNRGAYISATSNSFSTAPFVQIGNNGYYDTTNSRWEYVTLNAAAQYVQSANSHLWYTAAVGSADAEITDFATAKMTLGAGGDLLIGTTSNTSFSSRIALSYDSGVTNWAVGPSVTTPTGFFISANVGAQGVYLANATATSWTAWSDERLKDIIEPINNAVFKVGSLRAVIGKFKNDTTNTRKPFLIAQDVLAVLPEAVDVSNPDSFGVSYTDVIPLLVAAIKELTAEVNALKNA